MFGEICYGFLSDELLRTLTYNMKTKLQIERARLQDLLELGDKNLIEYRQKRIREKADLKNSLIGKNDMDDQIFSVVKKLLFNIA